MTKDEVLAERLEGFKSQTLLHFELLEREVRIAKEELNRRLESMNEFRAQLDKQARDFVTKADLSTVIFRVNLLEKESDRGAGATKWSDHIITVLIGIGVMIGVWLIRGKRNG
ncbi:MAG: hypothetical protein KJ888_20455 [Gammaproteobacteria bacterium]|uniref:Uncharacterized protein n=1 Tax=viral metagenome TaxID=1070528 RepID=A0A6M3JX94_9ZZZZ|nr:hypothetical protein [Gammaproteobacteria bacterium]